MMSAVLVMMLANVTQKRRPPPPPPRVEYFVSESRVFSADGKPKGIIVGLVRREYQPVENKIKETGIALDPAPDALPTVVNIEWAIEGDVATITEDSGRIKGKGRLGGTPWSWNEWAWNVSMKDVPGIFRNTAKVTRAGVTIRTEQVDASGKVLAIFDQVDTRIRKETYELLRSRLLPQ